MAQIFKNALGLADDFVRQARKETLNNRINYKGNYENYINGGSHALNNQARFNDQNQDAINIYRAKKGDVINDYTGDVWVDQLNDRYTNPEHNRIAGELPHDSGRNYIHRYTPSTRRGRRASDLYFNSARNGVAKTPQELFELEKAVEKYENNGRK